MTARALTADPPALVVERPVAVRRIGDLRPERERRVIELLLEIVKERRR